MSEYLKTLKAPDMTYGEFILAIKFGVFPEDQWVNTVKSFTERYISESDFSSHCFKYILKFFLERKEKLNIKDLRETKLVGHNLLLTVESRGHTEIKNILEEKFEVHKTEEDKKLELDHRTQLYVQYLVIINQSFISISGSDNIKKNFELLIKDEEIDLYMYIDGEYPILRILEKDNDNLLKFFLKLPRFNVNYEFGPNKETMILIALRLRKERAFITLVNNKKTDISCLKNKTLSEKYKYFYERNYKKRKPKVECKLNHCKLQFDAEELKIQLGLGYCPRHFKDEKGYKNFVHKVLSSSLQSNQKMEIMEILCACKVFNIGLASPYFEYRSKLLSWEFIELFVAQPEFNINKINIVKKLKHTVFTLAVSAGKIELVKKLMADKRFKLQFKSQRYFDICKNTEILELIYEAVPRENYCLTINQAKALKVFNNDMLSDNPVKLKAALKAGADPNIKVDDQCLLMSFITGNKKHRTDLIDILVEERRTFMTEETMLDLLSVLKKPNSFSLIKFIVWRLNLSNSKSVMKFVEKCKDDLVRRGKNIRRVEKILVKVLESIVERYSADKELIGLLYKSVVYDRYRFPALFSYVMNNFSTLLPSLVEFGRDNIALILPLMNTGHLDFSDKEEKKVLFNLLLLSDDMEMKTKLIEAMFKNFPSINFMWDTYKNVKKPEFCFVSEHFFESARRQNKELYDLLLKIQYKYAK